MLLHSGNGPEMLDGPRIDRRRPVIEVARNCNPESAPEQCKDDRTSRGARPQDQPRDARISEVKKPFRADRPSDRRATADSVEEWVFVDYNVNPAVDREQEIRKCPQNAAESFRVNGQTDKHI